MGQEKELRMAWKGVFQMKNKQIFIRLWTEGTPDGMVKADGMGWTLGDMR